MKSPIKSPISHQVYHWLFVLLLIGVFLFVTFMSNGKGFKQFEANFYKSSFLIENFNRLRMKLGDRVFPSVLIANDGWMEYTAEKNLDDYQNAVNFSPETLQVAAERIQACYQYARERNITFLIAVAPNKASIYPEKMPQQIQPLSSLSRLDQLNHYLRTQHIPEVLDLRPALQHARQERDVYHKWGTHWNEYGAYAGYGTIINVLSRDYPDLKPYSAKFLRFRSASRPGTSRKDQALAGLIQANYLPPEPSVFAARDLQSIAYQIDFGNEFLDYHEISWIPESQLPSLLVFHDSFGNFGLNKFLALNFSKVSYVHRGSSHVYLNKKLMDQFSPDIVIYEVVERYLYLLPNDLLGCTTD